MEITKVQLTQNGYLVNDYLSVPNDINNRHYKMVKEWLKNNIAIPYKSTNELLAEAKTNKKEELKVAFEVESNKPVPVNGVSYVGGFDSAVKLDAAKRMLETALATEVTFFDVDNKPHTLTFSEATDVILAIGAKYQTDFAKHQGLKVQVDGKLKVSTVTALKW